MSEWLQLHHEVFAHPKTRRLAKVLGISCAHAAGNMASLWAFTARFAPDGDISRFDPEDIEIGAGWEGGEGVFILAATTAGYLDRDGEMLSVHDWSDYGGKLVQKRAAERKRLSEHRENAKRTQYVRRTKSVRTQSVGVEERREEKIKSIASDLPSEAALEWWKAYGKKGSRADALTLWEFWCKSGASPDDLLTAATNYVAFCTTSGRLQLDGRTFLAKRPNRWEEWVKPEPRPCGGNGNGNAEPAQEPAPPGKRWARFQDYDERGNGSIGVRLVDDDS